MKEKIVNKLILGLFACLFWSVEAFADKWPEIPVPPKAKLIVVSDLMEVNGVQMKAWELKSWSPYAKIKQFYLDEWEDDKGPEGEPGVISYEMGAWDVLSRLENGYQITIQFDSAVPDETKAVIGITDLPSKKTLATIGRGFSKVGNMEVMNDIRAKDMNKDSRTIIALTDSSVKHSVAHYRRVYRRKGWEEQTRGLEYEGQENFGLMFNRRGKELSLTVSKSENKTAVVAVFVDF